MRHQRLTRERVISPTGLLWLVVCSLTLLRTNGFHAVAQGQEPYGLLLRRGESVAGWGAETYVPEVLAEASAVPGMSGVPDLSRAPELPSAPGTAVTAGVPLGVGVALPATIGDSGGFACGTLKVGNNIATLGHPLFGCSRLNLAENGRVLPTNRFFAEWRHFENIIATDVFSVPQADPPIDNSSMLDTDRVTFGMEKKFCDGLFSIEVRLPFHGTITPEIEVYHEQSARVPADAYPNVAGVPITSEVFTLGNVGLAVKTVLYRNRYWAFTGGVGLKLPTARDVTIKAVINDDDFRIYDPSYPNPPGYGEVDLDLEIQAMVANEVPDLLPYIALAYTPNDRFFTQGFLQVDVPLNDSRGVLGVSGSTGVNLPGRPTIYIPVGFELAPNFLGGSGGISGIESLGWQTLMRLNTQVGYWIYKNPDNRFHSLAGLLEFHWTTTLGDAELAGPLEIISKEQMELVTGNPDAAATELTLGNEANRVDVVVMTVAAAIGIGKSEVTPSLGIPLTSGSNDPFDWELSLLMNRRF